VYYKSLGEDGKATIRRKVKISDIDYKGNPVDIMHLIRHRLG